MKKNKYLGAALVAAITCLIFPLAVSAAEKVSDSDYITIPVTKIWEHEGNENRPDSVTIQLKNGDEIVDTVTLTADNADLSDDNVWSGTFGPAPLKSEGGSIIGYTVEEISVDGYDSNIEQPVISPFQITSFGNKVTPASNDTYSFSGNLIVAKKGGNYCVWTSDELNDEETVILMNAVNQAGLDGIGAPMAASNTIFNSGKTAVYENKHGGSVTISDESIHFSDENVWSLFYEGICGYTLEKGASVTNTHINSENTEIPDSIITPPEEILDTIPENPNYIPEEAPDAPEENVDENPEVPDEGTDLIPEGTYEKTENPSVIVSAESYSVLSEYPKTGDSMNVVIWVTLAGLAFLAIVAVLIIRKHE